MLQRSTKAKRTGSALALVGADSLLGTGSTPAEKLRDLKARRNRLVFVLGKADHIRKSRPWSARVRDCDIRRIKAEIAKLESKIEDVSAAGVA